MADICLTQFKISSKDWVLAPDFVKQSLIWSQPLTHETLISFNTIISLILAMSTLSLLSFTKLSEFRVSTREKLSVFTFTVGIFCNWKTSCNKTAIRKPASAASLNDQHSDAIGLLVTLSSFLLCQLMGATPLLLSTKIFLLWTL